MAARAPGNHAGKDDGDDGVVPPPGSISRAELVKRWEYVLDNVGDEMAMELFMKMLLRDARAESAQRSKPSRKEQEEEELFARVFEPWHPPPPPGSAAPPPPPKRPRVDRTFVLGLRAPPHLLPPARPKHEGTTTTTLPSAVAAPAADRPDLGRSVKPANKNTPGGVS